MATLFSPLQIRNILFKNRIVVSPMCQYSSRDGFANDWHLVHLGSRAIGGASLIIAEATAVSPEGRITHEDLGLYKEEHIAPLKRITDFISTQGAIPGIQLAHAGRKASHHSPWKGGAALKEEADAWHTVAPSAVAFKETEPVPAALSLEGIEKVITDFKQAAERALKAGFKVIELHAAHGYLLHQFLSPLSNHRADDYGGSFENRVRLLLEVVEEVRGVWTEDYPLFVRISSTDWVQWGWSTADSVALSAVLKQKGVDLIDCSSGGAVSNAKITITPGYQVGFAERIKKETGILTGAVGLITTPQQADDIITGNLADMVMMARELLRDPYFPLHAAKALHVELPWPDQYLRAK